MEYWWIVYLIYESIFLDMYIIYVYIYIHILYNCVAFPQKTQKKQLNIYAYILVGFVLIVYIYVYIYT